MIMTALLEMMPCATQRGAAVRKAATPRRRRGWAALLGVVSSAARGVDRNLERSIEGEKRWRSWECCEFVYVEGVLYMRMCHEPCQLRRWMWMKPWIRSR